MTSYDPSAAFRIHVPFDCRVDKVYVGLGANVKPNDPLLEVFSTELAEAKSNYETAVIQWMRDKKVLDFKAPLVTENVLRARN